MALPPNVTFGTVVGRFLTATADSPADQDRDPEGIAAAGLKIRFTPGVSPALARDATSSPPTVFALADVVATVDSDGVLVGPDGQAGIRLVAPMNDALEPNGWPWRVVISGDSYPTLSFSFPLYPGATIDLASVVQVPADPGTTLAAWLAAAARAEAAATRAEAAAGSGGGGGGTGAVSSVAGRTGAVVLAKADVALGNVDNTSDLSKPISTAQAAVNAAKADLVGGVIPSSQIPAIALHTSAVVASQAAMLALTSTQVQQGDLAVRTDGAGTFILNGADPSQLASWRQLTAPTDVVTSVAGKNGVVTLGKADVALSAVDNTADVDKPISTVQAAALLGKLDALGAPVTLTAAGTLTAAVPNLLDATAAAFTATLPNPTKVGQIVMVERKDAGTNLISIGGTVRGVASAVTLPGVGVAGEAVVFEAESLTSWRILASHKPKALLDKQFAALPSGTPAAGKYVDGGTNTWTTLPTSSGGSTTTPGSGTDLVEGADVHSDGHSYGVANIGGTGLPRTTWFQRLQTRLRATSYTNNNVSGAQAPDTAGVAAAGAAPAFRGLILWDCTINDANRNATTGTLAGFQAALLTWLLIRRAAAKFDSTTYATESGTWATVSDSYAAGGSVRSTTAQNSAQSYAVTGATKWFVTLAGGVGANSFGTAVIAVDGTTVATVPLTGVYAATQNNGSRTCFPYAVPITVPNTSAHTITVTKTDSGTGPVMVDALYANPVAAPIIVLNKAIYPGTGASTATVDTYNAAIDTVVGQVATDGTIIITDPQAAGFAAATMTADGLHPNNLGAAFMATVVREKLAALPAATSTAVRLGADNNGTVVIAAAVATPGGAAPTALTLAATPGDSQVTVSATGGTGATSYALYRGTVATGTPIATSFPFTDTGRANGTAVSYIATATNGNGTVTSNTVTATPAAAPAGVSDTFTRADNASTFGTSSSGTAWDTPAQGTWGISSNLGYQVSGSDDDRILITTGLGADQDVTVTLSGSGGYAGLIARAVDGNNYYLADIDISTGVAHLYKKIGGNYSQIQQATITGMAATGVACELIAKGTTLTVKVNGTAVITATDSSITTGTKAGFRGTVSRATSRFKNFSVTAS